MAVVDDAGLRRLIARLTKAQCIAKSERIVQERILNDLDERIFEDSRNANNQPLGNYKKSTVIARQRANIKPASGKIRLQFSGQMRDDFKTIPQKNGWAYGFSNNFNAKKANWNEERFGDIFKMTDQEEQKLNKIYNEAINDCIGG